MRRRRLCHSKSHLKVEAGQTLTLSLTRSNQVQLTNFQAINIAIWSWKLWSPDKDLERQWYSPGYEFCNPETSIGCFADGVDSPTFFRCQNQITDCLGSRPGCFSWWELGSEYANCQFVLNIYKLPICNSGSLGTCQCRAPSLRRQPPRASDISSLPSPWMFCICCRPSPIKMHIFICFIIFLSHLAENVDFPFFQGGAR